MNYQSTFENWKQRANARYQDALAAMANDEAAKEDAFSCWLSFGTAGMRGELGIGPNRMNIYTVRRAAQGLAEQILAEGRQREGVLIGHDTRINSRLFAVETACVLAANGIQALLFSRVAGVPLISFSIQYLHAAAGVEITASHNPAKYNGFKVYGPDGGQLSGEAADAVTARIDAIEDPFAIETAEYDDACKVKKIVNINDDLLSYYLQCAVDVSRHTEAIVLRGDQLGVVYTPLYGTGAFPVAHLMRYLGVQNLHIVQEQAVEDGTFPTVAAPNPEDPGAFELAFRLARQVNAGLVLATDPDCDRLGAAVRTKEGEYRLLTGNQIGCLLLNYLASQPHAADSFAVRSIVSSPLSDRIAEAHGVAMRHTLTGFKYIAREIARSVQEKNGTFLFGFEESFGYLAGDFVRDKDACIAAMLLTEAACWYDEQGLTLVDVLRQLYETYGWHEEQTVSFTRTGLAGMQQIRSAMEALRSNPPAAFGACAVKAVEDYQTGLRRDAAGDTAPLTLPAADMLLFQLDEGSVILRPSGTEPKLKAYFRTAAATEAEAKERCEALKTAATALLEGLMA